MAREATSSYYNSKVVNLLQSKTSARYEETKRLSGKAAKDNADQLNNHLIEIVVTPSFT